MVSSREKGIQTYDSQLFLTYLMVIYLSLLAQKRLNISAAIILISGNLFRFPSCYTECIRVALKRNEFLEGNSLSYFLQGTETSRSFYSLMNLKEIFLYQ